MLEIMKMIISIVIWVALNTLFYFIAIKDLVFTDNLIKLVLDWFESLLKFISVVIILFILFIMYKVFKNSEYWKKEVNWVDSTILIWLISTTLTSYIIIYIWKNIISISNMESLLFVWIISSLFISLVFIYKMFKNE